MSKTSTLLLVSAALLSLAGCATDGTSSPKKGSALPPPEETAMPEPATDPDAPTCGADKLGEYVGQSPSDDVLAKIKLVTGDNPIRTIRPGQAVTMDFRANRLNVDIGEDGKIRRLYCS